MSASTLSDTDIAQLLDCSKRVETPGSKTRVDGKHERRDFRVVSEDGHHEFVLFTRQSLLIPNSFSAGMRWRSKTGEEVILIRCNGSDHPHGNALEHESFGAQQHIHLATERYIAAGRKAETYAMPTTSYSTLAGALHEVAKLATITGLMTHPDHPGLFNTS